jgi:Zn-finger nucleic acid-binding protein
MKVTSGPKYRGVSIDKGNMSKLIGMITENKIDQGIWTNMDRPDLREVLEIAIETQKLFVN